MQANISSKLLIACLQESTAVAMQRCDKHVSTATNQPATIEELSEVIFSVWSVLRIYIASSHEFQVNSANSWLAIRNCVCCNCSDL
jgi:hypothetical protein